MWVGSIEACPFFFRRCFGSSVKKSVETVQLCCWTSQGQTEKETVTITSIIPIILLIGSPIIIINHKCVPFIKLRYPIGRMLHGSARRELQWHDLPWSQPTIWKSYKKKQRAKEFSQDGAYPCPTRSLFLQLVLLSCWAGSQGQTRWKSGELNN